MLQVICSGVTPYDVGLQHGSIAAAQVKRSVNFYRDLFRKTARLEWDDVLEIARNFDEKYLCPKAGLDDGGNRVGESGEDENGTNVRVDRMGKGPNGFWLQWREEMRGIAYGAGVPYHAILALNIRTEIAYGMSQDGCTAISWKTPSGVSLLAQNWDWQEEQKENLIQLCIRRPQHLGRPVIDMITEAGIIGKIGLNNKGVGVCLNAISAVGVEFSRLPVHLALRACLESEDAQQAVQLLEREGVASACHILVMDCRKGVGLECSIMDVVALLPDRNGMVKHTNHFIEEHPGVQDKLTLKDSPQRLQRLAELVQNNLGRAGTNNINDQRKLVQEILADECNAPTAICRSPSGKDSISTLFSILMNLSEGEAEVTVGRPSQSASERITLKP